MLLRCELEEALRKWMTREGLTQAQVAKHLGVVQPRISEIACNMVDKLSLHYPVGLCAKAGLTAAAKLARIVAPCISRLSRSFETPTILALCSDNPMACYTDRNWQIRFLCGSA